MHKLLGLLIRFDLTNYIQKSKRLDGVFIITNKMEEFDIPCSLIKVWD